MNDFFDDFLYGLKKVKEKKSYASSRFSGSFFNIRVVGNNIETVHVC
jgi:hypothetical protein